MITNFGLEYNNTDRILSNENFKNVLSNILDNSLRVKIENIAMGVEKYVTIVPKKKVEEIVQKINNAINNNNSIKNKIYITVTTLSKIWNEWLEEYIIWKSIKEIPTIDNTNFKKEVIDQLSKGRERKPRGWIELYEIIKIREGDVNFENTLTKSLFQCLEQWHQEKDQNYKTQENFLHDFFGITFTEYIQRQTQPQIIKEKPWGTWLQTCLSELTKKSPVVASATTPETPVSASKSAPTSASKPATGASLTLSINEKKILIKTQKELDNFMNSPMFESVKNMKYNVGVVGDIITDKEGMQRQLINLLKMKDNINVELTGGNRKKKTKKIKYRRRNFSKKINKPIYLVKTNRKKSKKLFY